MFTKTLRTDHLVINNKIIGLLKRKAVNLINDSKEITHCGILNKYIK